MSERNQMTMATDSLITLLPGTKPSAGNYERLHGAGQEGQQMKSDSASL